MVDLRDARDRAKLTPDDWKKMGFSKEKILEEFTHEQWEQFGVTKERFIEVHTLLKERDKTAPSVGEEAPDFELKKLDEHGKLTDQTIRLSSLRGKPVALVFGSYT